MRILISVGYNKLLLAATKDVGSILSALDGAVEVDEQGGWNEPKHYLVKNDSKIEVTLVPDDSNLLPEKAEAHFELFRRVANEKYELEQEVRTLKKELEKTRNAAPGESEEVSGG